MTDRAQVLIQAIDGATDVLDKIERKFASTTAVTDKLKYAMGALGAGLSIHAFTSMIENTIEAEAALYKLSQRTGETVEMLSALKGVAKASGTDMESVATMTQRLSKNLFEFAETGKGKASQAFEALGFSQKQARDALQDMDKFLPEFAKKLTESGSAAEQVAMAQQLMGKAGANALPFLIQLAETGKLVGKVTTEQAKAAHEYEINMAKLTSTGNALKNELANNVVPWLNAVTEAMLKARTEGGLLAMVFAGIKTAWSGGDRFEADKKLFELTERRLILENQIANARDPSKAFRGLSVASLKTQMAEVDAQIAAVQKVRQAFEASDAAKVKPKPKGGGKPDDGGGALPGMSDHDLEVWRMAKEAVHELEAADLAEEKAAEALRKARERLNAELDKEAETFRRLIDPTRIYVEQLKQVADLVSAGKLTPEEGDAAMVKLNDQINKTLDSMNAVKGVTKETDDFAKKMGLSMQSAFENAVIKGKSLRDVLRGLDQDIAQMILRKSITEPLGNAISGAIKDSGVGSSLMSFFGFGGAKASGGPVSGGQAYLVGENGPEIMVPGGSGTVVPNSALGGMGSNVNIHFNVTAMDARSFAQNLAPMRGLIVGMVRDAFNQRGVATALG